MSERQDLNVLKRGLAQKGLIVLTALAFALSFGGDADAARKKKRKAKPRPAPVKAEPIAWETLARDGPGGKICFAVAEPKEKFPASYAHGAVFFMISSWKTGGPRMQPSLSVSYALNTQIPPAGLVESSRGRSPQVRFYIDGTDAFIARPDQEIQLVNAMRSGRSLRIDATSADNVRTSYEFSLSGFSAAWDAAARLCA
ncbi:MAG: invasion associated locus B family protein [Caulobacterales bacterium]